LSGADRPTFRQQAKTRSAIQATKIVQRLQDHVEDRCDMSQTQIAAAQTLLRKVLPDLKVTDFEVDDHGRLHQPVSWDK
jgi:hypothetical protein